MSDSKKDELLKLLSYDPTTGILTWSGSPKSNITVGAEAGSIKRSDGYRYVWYRRTGFLAHRLCWELHYRKPPPQCIDHVNTIKSDNRIVNLRPATIAENNRNRPRQSNNTSGYKGVTLHKSSGKFHARITKDRVSRSLGYFDSAEAAADAYAAAAKEAHRDFARY